jgi:HJR/Mrr/RecB family endonuclease
MPALFDSLLQASVALVIFIVLVLVLVWLLNRDLKRFQGWSLFRRHQAIPSIVRDMSPREFELWTQQLFVRIGGTADVTGGRGDHGIDLVVKYAGRRIGVQCKKYFRVPGHPKFTGYVGEQFLRDLYGAQRHGNFDQVVLVTTGEFSSSAWKWSRGKRDLVLIDKTRLERILADSRYMRKLLG